MDLICIQTCFSFFVIHQWNSHCLFYKSHYNCDFCVDICLAPWFGDCMCDFWLVCCFCILLGVLLFFNCFRCHISFLSCSICSSFEINIWLVFELLLYGFLLSMFSLLSVYYIHNYIYTHTYIHTYIYIHIYIYIYIKL